MNDVLNNRIVDILKIPSGAPFLIDSLPGPADGPHDAPGLLADPPPATDAAPANTISCMASTKHSSLV